MDPRRSFAFFASGRLLLRMIARGRGIAAATGEVQIAFVM
jgi:hypothetical protein